MRKHGHCDSCGNSFPQEELTPLGSSNLCGDCLDSATTFCTHCGERIFWDENAGSRDTPLCQSCYERYYTECSQCGAMIRQYAAYFWDDEDSPLCHNCYTSISQTRAIHDYSYQPAPVFHGDGPRYFGVELEIDEAGEDNDNARELLDIANRSEENLYAKHDGSLEDGLELVSHPMTLDYHKNGMPWAAVLGQAIRQGYQSHKTRTCGLHVHISRAAFGETAAQQDAAIARLLFFFEKHWNELLLFSRRTPKQLEHWAARYGYKERPRDILDHAKKGGNSGRYSCINLQNIETIEVRIFRGTLKYNTLIATLELLDRLCDLAIYCSDEEVKAIPWSSFVAGIPADTCPELVLYLKERRLYVNEPLETEADE